MIIIFGPWIVCGDEDSPPGICIKISNWNYAYFTNALKIKEHAVA
jgi:hypothetical protein